MEFRARLSFLRIAPRKVRLLAQSLVGRPVPDALARLSVTTKRSVDPMSKLIKSAVANAGRDERKADDLVIRSITVDEGSKLKRYRPRAFGRAAEILKRSSHVLVVLADRVIVPPDASQAQSNKASSKKSVSRPRHPKAAPRTT